MEKNICGERQHVSQGIEMENIGHVWGMALLWLGQSEVMWAQVKDQESIFETFLVRKGVFIDALGQDPWVERVALGL